jgi:AcrR family transcriptional regulator
VEDEQAVKALTPTCFDEALRARVCPRCPHGRANHAQPLRGEDLVEGSGELLIAVMEEDADRRRPVREPDQGGCRTHVKNSTTAPGATRPPGRPRNPEADQAILSAAFDLIAERGVGWLSMEGVAEIAGVGKSTIYRRWPSKAALIKDAFEIFARQNVPMPNTGNTRGDLVALVGSIISVYTTTPAGRILPELLAETARSPELAEALGDFWASRREVMFEVLGRGVARGELPADIDYELTNEFLLGPIYYRLLATRLPLTRERAEVIVDAVLKEASHSRH